MKSTKIAFVLIALFLLGSCANDDFESENSTDFISVSKQQEINLNQFNDPISLIGSIKAWTNKNKELIVYTETKSKKHVFILQNGIDNINIDNVFTNLMFLDHSFSLTKDSGEAILVQIKNKKESKEASSILSKINSKVEMNTVQGSGIVHFWISKESELSKDITYESLRVDGGGVLLGCSNGGVGSTSCSITEGEYGCSV